MNLMPRTLSEWFRGLRQRFFLAAVQVTAEEAVADLEIESIAIRRRLVEESYEAVDFAKKLDPGGDELKERIRLAFLDDMKEVGRIRAEVIGGRVSFEEGREALRDFPHESAGSATSLPTDSTGDGNRALPAAEAPDGPAQPWPLKRGRGRPRKHPRPEGNGQTGKASG